MSLCVRRYLYERDVFWETLSEALKCFEGASERGKVCDHHPQAVVRHKAGQHLAWGPAEQVELDVELFAFLWNRRECSVRNRPNTLIH